MIEARATMDPRDLARVAVLETWRRDGVEHWIDATGASMLPLIRPHDRLLVGFGDQDARRGDVIVFRHGGLIVAHRVVGRRERDGVRQLLAKGDNEPFATEEVSTSDLLGVVRSVDRGSGGSTRRGLGGVTGGVTAQISRIGGSLTRASVRQSSPIAKLPLVAAARVVRSTLSFWTSALAPSRAVESLRKGGDQP